MSAVTERNSVADAARELALEGFAAPGGRRFESRPAWAALRELGTELWLDTGDLDAASKLWSAEFSNLTTNNTLVNKEVQKGLFDELIPRAGRALRDADPSLTADELVTEVGFVVNCRTALRLVEAFDATVSVELHPGMADDAEASIAYGRRYYAVHPERFIVKVPMTPAGFLAARQLSRDGIPINYTLGFSARQNVLAAAFSRPAYVNVFMGRLNSFVADHGLGDGNFVGEKATMASQQALLEGRKSRGWQTYQIGASMRSASQLFDLAGLDVFTIPTAAAADYQSQFDPAPRKLESQVGRDFSVQSTVPEILDRLWTVDDGVRQAAEALEGADPSGWTGGDFAQFAREHGARDLFVDLSAEQRQALQAEGKIPKWGRWEADLRSGRVALDELLSLAALYSFVTDQAELDNRICRLLQEAGVV